MCIRDRIKNDRITKKIVITKDGEISTYEESVRMFTKEELINCLLYTSDAADERSSVDLGGRRIIKKKKTHRYK